MKRLLRILASLVCAFGAAASTIAATCSPTLFIQAAEYPTGGRSQDLAVADFNGDSFPDVLLANGNDGTLSVLLNSGDGTFGAPVLTNVGQTATAVAVADLRGNGTADAIVVTYSQIAVLLGHGDGTFDDPVFYSTTTNSLQTLVVGKFDGNDTVDVVVGSFYDDHLSFLPGNGNGTFGSPVPTQATLAVAALGAADFDGDGVLDVIVSNRDTSFVSLLLGHGDGTFGAPTDFIGGPSLAGLTGADLDGDGKLDIAVVSGTNVSVLLGNGSGSFQAALQYPTGITGGGGDVAAADLDHDGTLDLVVSSQASFYGSGNLVSTLHGNGDGTFSPGEPYLVGTAGALALADVNGDSFVDALTCGVSDPTLYVLLDTPTGVLVAVPDSTLPTSPQSPDFAAGDWNADGRMDFAWAYFGTISVVQADAAGRYEQTAAISVGGFNPQIYGVAQGRFHSGPAPDLVAATYNDVLVLAGNGDGTFQDPVGVLDSFQLGAITAGDFNGDGHEDIAVTQGCCGSGFIDVLLGNGDGTFQSAVQSALLTDAAMLLPADFNGDGRDDLAAVTNGAVRIFLGNGDGTLTVSEGIATINGNAQIAVGNFDGGALDLLVSDGAGHVSLYPGIGNGTFGSPTLIALSSNGGSVTVGDYNADGYADFAVTSDVSVLVFLGIGDGRFQAPMRTGGSTSAFLATGDITGNGRDDIAIIEPNAIAALMNSNLAASAQGGGAVTVGSPALLTAAAFGYGPVTYQWRKNGSNLSDGPTISGSTTDTLTIDPVSFGDAGSYDVVVTDSCGSAPSNAETLFVEFDDVAASSPFHNDIITVATAGITGGCGGGNYCPTAPVKRDQMAAFLLKSEHGSNYVPPPCSGVFADVPCPSLFADWVEQLAVEGITGGCGGVNFCPDDSVTRAQMAVFLLKTSQGSSYTPPAATGIFADVPAGSFAADFIEDLYNRGITGGCSVSPLLYCPGSSVLRQQMATFLVRTFGL